MGKAYTQKNTHLQTAQSQPTSQSLQESIFYPDPTEIKNKKSFPSQKNKTYNIERQRNINTEKAALGGNKVLPKWREKCFYETFVLNSTAVILLNFSAEIPPLRQYPARCRQLKNNRLSKKQMI